LTNSRLSSRRNQSVKCTLLGPLFINYSLIWKVAGEKEMDEEGCVVRQEPAIGVIDGEETEIHFVEVTSSSLTHSQGQNSPSLVVSSWNHVAL